MKLRQIVLENQRPRSIWVQGNTQLVDENVVFVEYGNTPEGLVQSMLDRFDEEDCLQILEQYAGEKDVVTDIST